MAEDMKPEAQPRGGAMRLFGAIAGGVPTVIVLAALAGIAWWGHRNGWKLPGFAQVVGAAAGEEQEDWCAEHNVPESVCIACNPALVGASAADWCKEHGVPESKCTICHPEILTTGVAGDWCREHGVPETSCPVCHEEIAVRAKAPESEDQVKVLPANHFKPDMSLARNPTTRPGKDPKTCQTHARRIQFASVESVKKAGIKLAAVAEGPVSATLTANAESDYDRTRYAQVASPVSGRVWRMEKELGQRVKKGEVLALVDSVEVGNAKAELLEATATVEVREKTLGRIKESAAKGLRTEADLLEAEAAVKEARIKLFNARQAMANLGLPTAADAVDTKAEGSNRIPLVTPLDGVVVQRSGVAGELVDSSKALFAIADTSRMWITMDIPVAEARRIKLGQDVRFLPDGAPDYSATGKVAWISTAVDDQTRTVRVRADVENADGQLRAMTFGRAVVAIRQTPNAIVVPTEAVQWEGCCHIAFVRLSDTIFQVRKLRIGTKSNGQTEVILGVLPGEVVASGGSQVLKSELLKANLGAGCADH